MTKEFDPNEPAQTRDGRPARIVDTKLKGGRFDIVAIIERDDGTETIIAYTSAGKFHAGGRVSGWDLINIPKKHTVWMNMYKDGTISTRPYPTREEADTLATPRRIACVEVTYTEGEGLDND